MDTHSRNTDELLNHFSDQDIGNTINLSLEIIPLKPKILHHYTKEKYLIDLDVMYKVMG